MASQVQYRRGTNAQNAAFTGALAEITVDTTNGTVRVHDAITVGGSNIATVAYVTAQISALSANSISFGTSNVRVVSSGGNVTTSVGATSNVVVVATTGQFVTGLMSVTGTVTSASVVGGAITGSSTSVTGTTTAASVVGGVMTGSSISVSGTVTGTTLTGTGLTVTTGNITGGNLLLSGAIEDSAQLDVRTTASNANIVFTPNGSGNVNVTSNVMPTANSTANIGSTTLRFNTIHARATSAQYADLAEMYLADENYVPGTVIEFGGVFEVTQSNQSHSAKVAGIVSTNPSYLMNATLNSANAIKVGLVGRVPCRVVGTISKGDRLVASSLAGVATVLDPVHYTPGCIIGKALETYNSATVGVIEVAVGRI